MNAHSNERCLRIRGRVAPMRVSVVVLSLLLFSCGGDPAAPEEKPVPFGLQSVGMVDDNKIRIGYTRTVDGTSGGDVRNYQLLDVAPLASNPIGIYRADVQPDGRVVILTTDRLDVNRSYRLAVDRVEDGGDGVISSEARDVVTIVPSGTIVTWAGAGRAAFDGDGNIPENSYFYFPVNLEWTSTGCYILDWNNHRVRRLTQQGTFETAIGTALLGDGDANFIDRDPPGAPGTEINLNHPTDVDEMPDGRILLTCWHNHKLRIYDPVTTLAYVIIGDEFGYDGDGGDARPAHLSQPNASHVLPDGTIYILDQRNLRIRKIDGTTNVITTVAGTGTQGYGGDGGDPLLAQFNFPIGPNPPVSGSLTMDGQGRLYVSDRDNHRIRRIDFGQNMIETVAGDGTAGYAGDGGAAISASLDTPADIDFGPDGRLYIADEMNNRIRAVDLTTGIIMTVAGNGEPAFAGDGGPATAASLYRPWGIAFDVAGYLYIADTFNHRIRRVIP